MSLGYFFPALVESEIEVYPIVGFLKPGGSDKKNSEEVYHIIMMPPTIHLKLVDVVCEFQFVPITNTSKMMKKQVTKAEVEFIALSF